VDTVTVAGLPVGRTVHRKAVRPPPEAFRYPTSSGSVGKAVGEMPMIKSMFAGALAVLMAGAAAAQAPAEVLFRNVRVFDGTEAIYGLVRKHRIKTAFGTDILFSESQARRPGALLVAMKRRFTLADTLRMATSTNGELLALSGLRSPYVGKLGVVEERALADLLLVEGDPIANIRLIEDPERNLRVIMKDGRIYKHSASLARQSTDHAPCAT